jgi:hypothetical protein
MTRKTVRIEDLRTMINSRLKDTPDSSRAEREAYSSLLESLLHETGNYNGFRYLSESELPFGSKPGIRDLSEDVPSFHDTDSTRVHYF